MEASEMDAAINGAGLRRIAVDQAGFGREIEVAAVKIDRERSEQPESRGKLDNLLIGNADKGLIEVKRCLLTIIERQQQSPSPKLRRDKRANTHIQATKGRAPSGASGYPVE